MQSEQINPLTSADRPYGAVLVSQISQAIKRKGLIWPDNINCATLHITDHEEYMIYLFSGIFGGC